MDPNDKTHITHSAGVGAAPDTNVGVGCSPADKLRCLAHMSPRAALAAATGAVRAPFVFNVEAVFTSVTQETATASMDATVLGNDVFIQEVTYDLQAPSAFAGTEFKSLSDFFYNKTSGMKAQVEVLGRPRYTICQDFTPLANLFHFVPSNQWPEGWMLTRENGIKMIFTPGTTLPEDEVPLTVVVTYLGWQYVSADIDGMSTDEVLARLKALGIDIGSTRSQRLGTY